MDFLRQNSLGFVVQCASSVGVLDVNKTVTGPVSALWPLNRFLLKPSVVLVFNGDVSILRGGNEWTGANKRV